VFLAGGLPVGIAKRKWPANVLVGRIRRQHAGGKVVVRRSTHIFHIPLQQPGVKPVDDNKGEPVITKYPAVTG